MSEIKNLKKLLLEGNLDNEKFNSFIQANGIERAIKEIISITKEMEEANFYNLIDLINSADENFRFSFLKEIILNQNIYFPYKEIVLNKINLDESLIKSDILDSFENSKKIHWGIIRNLEEKKISEQFFDNIIKKFPILIEQYLRNQAKKDINQIMWIFSYYGKDENFDSILLNILKTYPNQAYLEIIEEILKKNISKKSIKNLKKIRFLIEKSLREKKLKKEEEEIARIHKAWLLPYFSYSVASIIIMNYLPNTENYIIFIIFLKNLKIVNALVFMEPKEENDERNVLSAVKNILRPAYKFMKEWEPSLALHYVNLLIKWNKNKNRTLPEDLEKYLPALLIKYDKSKINLIKNLFGEGNIDLYKAHFPTLFNSNIFRGWFMERKAIIPLFEKMIELANSVSTIKLPQEAVNNRMTDIINDFLNTYWTNGKLNSLAFKLLINTYYFYSKKEDFLARVCYNAYKETFDKKMPPSYKEFLKIFVVRSYWDYLNSYEKSDIGKKILLPFNAKNIL